MRKRYLSLDVLRGITITFMCIVNNPGSWSQIFPPLRHAAWNGCTPTDLVYPFFVFCMGCAMAFSLAKFEDAPARGCRKVLTRGLLIFLVGLALNLYPFFPLSPHDPAASCGQNYLYWLGHRRILGVLQRIGLAYMLAGVLVLWLRKPKKLLVAVAVLCTVFTVVLLAFGREPGALTLEGNVAMRIDRWLIGSNHCYHGYGGTDFDPEGFLGTLTTACTCLLGYLCGRMIRNAGLRQGQLQAVPESGLRTGAEDSDPVSVVARLFVYGCLSLAVGVLLGIWIPINKPLWSASYVFYSGGWAMMALAFLAYCIDVKGIEKPFEPFKAMGRNALAAFVLAALIAKSYTFFHFSPSKYFGANPYVSLVYALLFTFVIFCFLWFFYKKKIVIKL